VLSGIQPSGALHLGNYLGAVRNYIKMSSSHDALICIVDYHAMTNPTDFDPAKQARRTWDMAVTLLAAGLDPERATLFVQSQVPEVTELMWIFMNVTPMGELERMTQFKDKAARQHSVLSGLFSYPVLQAADILIYKAEEVPVGEDQLQHLELTRDIARKFNLAFGETFPEPKAVVPEDARRILGLDGKAKMSKSLGNTIGLMESPAEAWSKLRGAVTDPARIRRADPGNPFVCNIHTLHKNFSPPGTVKMVEEGCATAGIGCIDCKRFLFEYMERDLAPIRERAEALESEPERVREILAAGAARARGLAKETMAEVREKVGFYKP
jgi:tryptophanyl-tRNA synthetase